MRSQHSARSFEFNRQFIDITPARGFTWLQRGHDGVPGLVKMPGGVLVFRVVAAADMAAGAAQAQVHPGIAGGETFLATIGIGLVGFHETQMGTLRGHGGSLFAAESGWLQPNATTCNLQRLKKELLQASSNAGMVRPPCLEESCCPETNGCLFWR